MPSHHKRVSTQLVSSPADSRSIYRREFAHGKCPYCSYKPKNITACNAKRHLQMVHPGVFHGLSASKSEDTSTRFLRQDVDDEDETDETETSTAPSSSLVPQFEQDSSCTFFTQLLNLPALNGIVEPKIESKCRSTVKRESEDNAQLVADLMRQFYKLGWVYGAGGAMCIRNDENFTFVTPSGVQKDRLKPEDIGMYDQHNELVIAPQKPNVVSSCVNLFWTIFRTNDKQNPNRPLNSVIHTHSLESNLMASFPTAGVYDHVRLSSEEMLKGIVDRASGGALTNTQTCVIPVIENSPSEGCPEFKERIQRVMLDYPGCSAILVRNHGAFYFGQSWEETKTMAEIFEYLFKLTLEKIKFAPQFADRVFRSAK